MSKPPVFIVGVPRSGTTLVSNLLNATDEIYFPEETHFFQLFEKYKAYTSAKDFQNVFTDPAKNPYLEALSLTEDLLLELRARNMAPGELLEKICSSKAKERGVSRWGEKTPIHFMHINTISGIFPNALFINIFRDPRDVMNSIRKAGWGYFDLLKSLHKYQLNVKAMKSFSNGHVLSIKYEDLVNSPYDQLMQISQFIDLPINTDILDKFYEPENINFSLEHEPWKIKNLKPITNANAFKWKKSKNFKEREQNKFISWFLMDEIAFLNYEAYQFPNLASRLITWGIIYTVNITLSKIKNLTHPIRYYDI